MCTRKLLKWHRWMFFQSRSLSLKCSKVSVSPGTYRRRTLFSSQLPWVLLRLPSSSHRKEKQKSSMGYDSDAVRNTMCCCKLQCQCSVEFSLKYYSRTSIIVLSGKPMVMWVLWSYCTHPKNVLSFFSFSSLVTLQSLAKNYICVYKVWNNSNMYYISILSNSQLS